MQLVVIDTLVVGWDGFQEDMIIERGHISQCLSVYKLGHRRLTDEERAKKDLISEILNTEEDIGGSIRMKFKSAGIGLREVSVIPSVPEKSIFKSLVRKFQEKVKISVCLKWVESIAMTFISLEGMTIDSETFTCSGVTNSPLVSSYGRFPKMHVKLVADIDIPIPIKELSFAQMALDRGVHSDVIISAGNGAEIKALKAFLSVCSPVLEAMLQSGMQESQTGRVDMSDVSEEGVRAFLRFVYYNDLRDPKEDIQVAYELLYASHKYDVPRLESEIRTLLLEMKNEDIGQEWAFKIYMLARNIDDQVEVKRKAIEVLSMLDDQPYDVSSLEHVIETFLAATNDDDIDAAVALKMYIIARNVESAMELKNKAFRILKTKWLEVESLQEYNDLFEKPSYSRAAKDLCRDLAMALLAATT